MAMAIRVAGDEEGKGDEAGDGVGEESNGFGGKSNGNEDISRLNGDGDGDGVGDGDGDEAGGR